MKTAVCLSGHVRTFAETLEAFRRYVVEPLKADLFIHTWGEPERQAALAATLKGAYHPVGMEIDAPRSYPELASSKLPAALRDFAENLQRCKSMWSSIARADQLRSAHESTLDRPYDVVVRCRFDLQFLQRLFRPEEPLSEVQIPRLLGHRKYRLFTDTFAYGPSALMSQYAGVSEHFAEAFCGRHSISDEGAFIPELGLTRFLSSTGMVVRESDVPFLLRRESGKFVPLVRGLLRWPHILHLAPYLSGFLRRNICRLLGLPATGNWE